MRCKGDCGIVWQYLRGNSGDLSSSIQGKQINDLPSHSIYLIHFSDRMVWYTLLMTSWQASYHNCLNDAHYSQGRVCQHHSLCWISCQVDSLDSWWESGRVSNPSPHYHLPHHETYQWQRQGLSVLLSALDIMLSWPFGFLTRIRMSQ